MDVTKIGFQSLKLHYVVRTVYALYVVMAAPMGGSFPLTLARFPCFANFTSAVEGGGGGGGYDP